MSLEGRVEKVEEHVPESCIRHDLRLQAVEEFAKDVRDNTKFVSRAVIGSLIAFLVTTALGLMIVGALARTK
jgi:hypothetical protein